MDLVESADTVPVMADTERDELETRLAAARDFAQAEARRKFADAATATTGTEKYAHGSVAGTYRAIGRVLNVALGVEPDEGDPAPPRTE